MSEELVLHYHIALPNTGTVPEWIQLLPTGTFSGRDGRGPYHVRNAQQIISRSLKQMGGKLVVDENHSTDILGPKGGSTPAMGWITELQARADGIWGKVGWTKKGKSLLQDQAYRGISPVFAASSNGDVQFIARASVTNTPNLAMTTLHSEQTGQQMEEKDILAALGVAGEGVNAPTALKRAAAALTLHAEVSRLAGLDATASQQDILAALQKKDSVTLHTQQSLEQHNQQLQARIESLEKENRLEKAERFVQGAGRSKVISEETKTALLELHSANPALAQIMVNALPDVPDATLVTHSMAVSAGKTTSALEAKMDAALGLTAKGAQ